MFGLSEELLELERSGKPLYVSIIGVGQMGRALVAQLVSLPGICPSVIVDHKPSRAVKALLAAGVPLEKIAEVETPAEADAAAEKGCYAVSGKSAPACAQKRVQVVIDATGNVEGAAEIALEAFANKKHLIMMTVETDVLIGPLLNRKAKQAGVIFTGMAGDEPGAIMELYDFARTIGFDVLVLGKGKNNAVDYDANPQSVLAEAEAKEMNPRMLASFKDCTKTMIELAAVANATGFLPDCSGGHGIEATPENLAQRYSLRSEGGVLSGYRVVDYARGVAPGVFAVVTTPKEELRKELTYLLLGPGPNYLLYRPYHLCSMEIPMTVGRLLLHGRPSLQPMNGAPYAEVVAYAKRDLQIGEKLDGIGGFTVYGVMESYSKARADGALPVGLTGGCAEVVRPLKKGQPITLEDVRLDEDSLLVRLRREQDRLLEEDKP